MRENGSTGGVLYHNNTDGTCGWCNSQIERLLPKDAELLVIPPADAVAKKNAEQRKIQPPTRAMTSCQSPHSNMISSGSSHEN
jgi:hypothetical protein